MVKCYLCTSFFLGLVAMNRLLFISLFSLIAICLNATVSGVEMAVDSSYWLDDVTVTAIKQQPDLSLQPVAATVVDEVQVKRWNVNAIKGMSEIAPNFYIPNYGSRMTSSIYVRGIGARMEQPAIGLSVDNVTMLNKDNYDFDINDIERIEVLRGSHSTLYGRNTMAGQVNIYTLQPMKYQGTRAVATVGNGAVARLSLSHYMLMHSNLAMGFSGSFNFSDGFYKNAYNAQKIGTEKGGNLRWKTQWQASSSVAVDNVASFSLYRQGGYPYELEGSGLINYNDTCFYRRDAFTDGLTIKWTKPGFSLSSITSFQYLDDNMTLDQDFQPVDYFTLTQHRHEWALTQDVVARGVKGKYSWLAGVFGFYKRTSMAAPVTLKEDGISRLITGSVNNNPDIPIRLEWGAPEILLGSRFKIPTWGLAAYHQSSLDLERWSFALGLRLDYESTRLRYNSMCNTSYSAYMKSGMPPMPILTKEVVIDDKDCLSQDFLEFLPKLTITYRLPMLSGSSLYASVGKGYKSGGYNTQMFSEVLQQRMMKEAMSGMPGGAPGANTALDVDQIVSYKPEKSWNYELGAHIGCADGRVMTDIALFYIDCRDQQLTMFPDESTTGRITTNAGKTRSFGAEVQVRYNPTDRWSFQTSYGYTNAKFVQFVDGASDYRGKYVPYAPVNTLFGSVSYTHPITDKWHLAYNLRCRGVGHIYWNEANDSRQPMYALMGASVTARCSWVSFEAWMDNMTGTDYDVFRFTSMKNNFVQKGLPRTFGFTVRMEFGADAQ